MGRRHRYGYDDGFHSGFVTAVNRMEGMERRVHFRHFASGPNEVAAFKAAASQH